MITSELDLFQSDGLRRRSFLSKLRAPSCIRSSAAFWPSIRPSLWCDLAGALIPTRASTLINTAATHHIGYGSGCCRTPSAVEAREIASLNYGWDAVSDAPWRELTTRKAQELLGCPLLRASIECGYA